MWTNLDHAGMCQDVRANINVCLDDDLLRAIFTLCIMHFLYLPTRTRTRAACKRLIVTKTYKHRVPVTTLVRDTRIYMYAYVAFSFSYFSSHNNVVGCERQLFASSLTEYVLHPLVYNLFTRRRVRPTVRLSDVHYRGPFLLS